MAISPSNGTWSFVTSALTLPDPGRVLCRHHVRGDDIRCAFPAVSVTVRLIVGAFAFPGWGCLMEVTRSCEPWVTVKLKLVAQYRHLWLLFYLFQHPGIPKNLARRFGSRPTLTLTHQESFFPRFYHRPKIPHWNDHCISHPATHLWVMRRRAVSLTVPITFIAGQS